MHKLLIRAVPLFTFFNSSVTHTDIESLQNRLLKVCYVPATSANLQRLLFLLRPLTVLIKQTRQAVRAIKQSILLRCLWFHSILLSSFSSTVKMHSSQSFQSVRISLLLFERGWKKFFWKFATNTGNGGIPMNFSIVTASRLFKKVFPFNFVCFKMLP
jgi:hypothetical protein